MFKDVLKQLRDKKGLTQEELAIALDVTAGTIGNYEQGQRLPKDDKMWIKIANYFGVTVDYLMDVENINDVPTPIAAYNGTDPLKKEISTLVADILNKTDDITKLELLKNVISSFED